MVTRYDMMAWHGLLTWYDMATWYGMMTWYDVVVWCRKVSLTFPCRNANGQVFVCHKRIVKIDMVKIGTWASSHAPGG